MSVAMNTLKIGLLDVWVIQIKALYEVTEVFITNLTNLALYARMCYRWIVTGVSGAGELRGGDDKSATSIKALLPYFNLVAISTVP